MGQNKASADVLPVSEIRSAPPVRTVVANNLIYNTRPDAAPVVNHDDMDGIRFEHNVISNGGETYSAYEGVLRSAPVAMQQINEWLFVPEAGEVNAVLDETYRGFEFERIDRDLFGSERGEVSRVGAVSDLAAARDFSIDRTQYGPDWFTPGASEVEPTVRTASTTAGELATTIQNANPGDVIELAAGTYTLDDSLLIDRALTLRGTGEATQLVFTNANAPAFVLRGGGNLRLQNLTLRGAGGQTAFAPLGAGMTGAYTLALDGCTVEQFDYILHATRGSFADTLQFHNSTFRDCANGLVLAADERGDYNAEMVFIDNSEFSGIAQNVVHFYRGGYDESTIGGFLVVTNSRFTECGRRENSGTLLRTRGILNVLLRDNTFRNNWVDYVAVLWGEKNNTHSGNELVRSGRIRVDEQQEQEVIY